MIKISTSVKSAIDRLTRLTDRTDIPPARIVRTILLLAMLLSLLSVLVIANRARIFLPVWITSQLGLITESNGIEQRSFKASTIDHGLRGQYQLKSPTLFIENSGLISWQPAYLKLNSKIWIDAPGILLEDGRMLPGPANSPLEEIADPGMGRYTFQPDEVIFSTSDNSSPLTNRRIYEVTSPLIVGTGVAFAIYLLTVALVLLVSAANQRQWRSILQFHPLATGLSIFMIVFILTRGPFYLYYPFVWLAPDTASYLEPINQALRGELPLISIRPPGYPLFIYLTTLIADRWMVVVLGQSLLSLLAVILLICSIHRGNRALTIPAAVVISGFVGNSRFIFYETSALSESSYTSFLMIAFALLVGGLHERSKARLLLASLCGGLAILIKPAGIYLVVIFTIVTIFLLINRYRLSLALASLLPILVLTGSLAVYNRFTIGELAVSTFGECQIGAATAYFWEPDPAFPPEVNEKIRIELPASLARTGLDDDARRTIDATWHPLRLGELFEPYYDKIIYQEGWTLGTRFGLGYEEARPLIRKISLRSISRHPQLYLKFFWSSFASYYVNLQWKLDLYHYLNRRAEEILQVKKPGFSAEVAKEYGTFSASTPPEGVVIDAGSLRVALKDNAWQRLHIIWQGINSELFNNLLWILISMPVCALAGYRLFQSRLRDLSAFIVSIAFLSLLGSSLVVSIIQLGIERYSYPNHFLIYLIPILLPSIWRSMAASSPKS